MTDVTLSPHFKLSEFTRSRTAEINYIKNTPPPSAVAALTILCAKILEPARQEMDEPIVITSGYRNKKLNKLVGGVHNSQHTAGEAADIHVPSADYANRLCDILKKNPHVDQLLFEHIGSTVWIHVSCATRWKPRNMIRLNYKP